METGDVIGGGVSYSRVESASSADYVVSNKTQLLNALSTAVNGEVIYVADAAEIDMSGESSVSIPAGVVLAGGRGSASSTGGLIYTTDLDTNPLFVVSGNNVRITGFRLRGPDPERYTAHASNAIYVTGDNLEVDNNEIYNWSYSGVAVRFGATNTHIHHNYMHHIRKQGTGYSISLDEAAALIEANIFDWGRHAIAGTGKPGTSYEARYNIVLENFYAHPFDMHGGCDQNPKVYDDYAGDWIVVHHNTFYVTSAIESGDPEKHGIHISGTPREGAWIYNNWFIHDDRSVVISQRDHDSACNYVDDLTDHFTNMWAFQNRLGESEWGSNDQVLDDDKNGRYRIGDFNGDGIEDELYLGQTFWVRTAKSDGGFNSWSMWGSNGADIGPQRYKIGDFNGDGKDDVVSFESNRKFYVWLSSGSSFSSAALWGSNGADIGYYRYKIGDFNGDSKDDVISFESNNKFYVWTSTGNGFNGASNWGNNGADLWDRYKIYDVNNDSRSDVISFESNGKIYVWTAKSTGGFNGASIWGTNGADLGANGYKVGDYNGDGWTDLHSFESNGYVYVWKGGSGVGFDTPSRWFYWQ